ncbi:MAG: hypothetical protein ACM3PF_01815 [Bacteroidota bacterium]
MSELSDHIRAHIVAASWTPSGDAESRRSEELLLRSFRAQVASIPPYAAYVRHLGVDPARVARWQEIPPVPCSAFKSHDLSAAPEGAGGVTFETSGTTISQPGRVHLSDTALYEVSLLRNFERHLLSDGVRLRTIVFGPSGTDAPHSSLWFMVDRAVREFGLEASYIVQHGDPRWKAADDAIRLAMEKREPLLLLGTTLLFMAWFERLRILDRAFQLPAGSRAMDTGGAKGQISEFTRAEVEEAFQRHLRIPASHVVNEYGMAEMGSQFYDDALLAAHERREPIPGKHIPPWVRTRVLDPESMEELGEGETGVLVHYDLANLEVPLAIQTEDVGRRLGNRLILEGRLLGAEARGCSLSFEEFLRRERA